jgi:hypothetical protein
MGRIVEFCIEASSPKATGWITFWYCMACHPNEQTKPRSHLAHSNSIFTLESTLIPDMIIWKIRETKVIPHQDKTIATISKWLGSIETIFNRSFEEYDGMSPY